LTREGLEGFAVDLLSDLGASVSERHGLIWVDVPERLQSSLDLPAQAVLTLQPDRVGEFGAELLAPGSYLLERLLAIAIARGRWEAVRNVVPHEGWAMEILEEAGLPPGWTARVGEEGEVLVPIFSFRTTLTADDKRENFVSIAVVPGDSAGLRLPWSTAAAELPLVTRPPGPVDLPAAYETARATLSSLMRSEVEAFRKEALAALEEEVRRTFRYFDGTLAEIEPSAALDSESLRRAVEAERDRRLTEAVERLEPHATAGLASIRVVVTQAARIRLRSHSEVETDVRLDAFTRTIRGLRCEGCGAGNGPWISLRPDRCFRCAATEAGSAQLPGRRRSDTARPRRKAARAAAQSPRGSKERSRSSHVRRRRS
jgi:hypothetical protein